jgi:MFS transporter, DHA1 family, inner membrane transport protein
MASDGNHRKVDLVVPLSVFALFLVVFGFTTGEFVVAGILPDVAADLGVSIPAAGLLSSAYAIGMIIGGPVLTVLTARTPRRCLVVGLVTVSVLANLGSAVAPNHAVLLVARFGAGLVVATFFAVAIATAAAVAPVGRQGTAVARVVLGLNLGLVLGTPLGTAIGQQLGWRATFVAVAAVTLAAVPLVLRYVPAAPGTSASVPAPPAGSPPHISTAQLPAGRTGEPPEYVQYEGRLAGTPSGNLDPPIYAPDFRRRTLVS